MPRPSKGPMRTTLLLVALFPVFAFTYAGLVGTGPDQVFNSDLVQPFVLVRDFLTDPSLLAWWHLSPAIYVFPDYVFALLISLLHVGPVFSMIANGAVLGVLLTFAGGYLLHVAGVSDLTRACLAAAVAIFAAIVAGLVLPGQLATNMQIWTFSTFIHSGTLLSGVALVGLWTGAEIAAPRHRRPYVASLVLAGLASYSDVTFLIYFVLPVAIATGIAWLAAPERGRFGRTVLLAAVAVLGYMVDRMTRGNIGPGGDFHFARNVARWLDVIGPYLADNPLLLLFLLITPVMLVRALFLAIRALSRHRLDPAGFAEIALAGIQTISVLVPALFGLFNDIGHLRYSLPIASLPLFWLLILGRTWLIRPLPLRHPRIWIAGLWAVACGTSFAAAFAALPILTAKPPVIACMDKLGLEAAYAWYWDVKGPVFLSDYRVHMVQIEPDGRYSSWNTSDRWLTHSVIDDTPVFARAIDMRGLDADSVERIYGPPSDIGTCGDLVFWLYDHALPPPPR